MSTVRFGLPPAPNDSTSETQEARELRQKAVASLLDDAFSTAVEHFGVDQARIAWRKAEMSAHGRKGRPPKTTLSRKDRFLLKIYDGVGFDDQSPATLPRFLGQVFERNWRRHYQSAGAVERQLRRLLSARRKGKTNEPLPGPRSNGRDLK